MNLRGLLHSRLRKRRPSDSAVTPSGREEGSLVQVKEGTGEPSDEQVIIGAVSSILSSDLYEVVGECFASFIMDYQSSRGVCKNNGLNESHYITITRACIVQLQVCLNMHIGNSWLACAIDCNAKTPAFTNHKFPEHMFKCTCNRLLPYSRYRKLSLQANQCHMVYCNSVYYRHHTLPTDEKDKKKFPDKIYSGKQYRQAHSISNSTLIHTQGHSQGGFLWVLKNPPRQRKVH